MANQPTNYQANTKGAQSMFKHSGTILFCIITFIGLYLLFDAFVIHLNF